MGMCPVLRLVIINTPHSSNAILLYKPIVLFHNPENNRAVKTSPSRLGRIGSYIRSCVFSMVGRNGW